MTKTKPELTNTLKILTFSAEANSTTVIKLELGQKIERTCVRSKQSCEIQV